MARRNYVSIHGLNDKMAKIMYADSGNKPRLQIQAANSSNDTYSIVFYAFVQSGGRVEMFVNGARKRKI